MRRLRRAFCQGAREGEDAKWCQHRFLRQYRESPREATGLAPQEMLGSWAYDNGLAVRLPLPGKIGNAKSKRGREESTGNVRKHYEAEMQPSEWCVDPQRGEHRRWVAETCWQWRKCGHSRPTEQMQVISVENEGEEKEDTDGSAPWPLGQMAHEEQEIKN